MNEKKYIIYLDILGFGGLAGKIAAEKGIDQRDVRQKFINIIKERVEILEVKGKIIGKKYGKSDDWILVTYSLDSVFNCIHEILDHDTGYTDYKKIPLEIGIGTGEYDKWARFDGTNLIVEDDTIKFYKTNIIEHYHNWYKKIHNNQSPKSTFIVHTELAYHELEPLDRKICQEIEYKYKKNGGEGQVITFFAADADKVQQRGRVFEFLEKIGYAGSKWYGRVDEVYVPPSEYEEMARTLHERKILFITGTPEYGKTYTAVRLMWEFYNRGYEPRWILGGESAERSEVRRRLEDIGAVLKHGRIIYFEDPFGKTRYERREGLEREIGTMVDNVRQVEDVYVIITSREEVFKEFEKEKLSAVELQEFEKKLNIKNPSYDYEKRKEILLKWAGERNCKWLGTEKLKELVLKSLKDEKTLPTPLCIKNFAVATFNIDQEDELKQKIEEKSQETAKAFAEEIKNMGDDKILFLSFFFVYDYFEVEFVKEAYQELVEELNLKDVWGFDELLDWFKDDKIDSSDKYIGFSHPSYSEALPYLLVKDGYITRINKEIFSKLLFKLSENDTTVWDVAWVVRDNFDRLHEDTRNGLLLKLSENDKVVWDVVSTVAYNYDKLPENVRNLLFKFSETGETVWVVAEAVAYNYDKLPKNVRNLLFNLLERGEAAVAVAKAVASNFDKLPVDVRNELLLKISASSEAVAAIELSLVLNFDKLPKHVRNSFNISKPLQQLIEDLSGSVEPRTEVGKLLKAIYVDPNGVETIENEYTSR